MLYFWIYFNKTILHFSIGLKNQIDKDYRKLGCNMTAIYKWFLKVVIVNIVANGQNRLKPDVCSMFMEVLMIASVHMCLTLNLEKVMKSRDWIFFRIKGNCVGK